MTNPPRARWVYVYEIVPPQTEDTVSRVRALLDRENAAAIRAGHTWVSRLVLDADFTRILIVSETPARFREINQRLEAELSFLPARFSVSVPMAIPDDSTPTEPEDWPS